MELSEKHRIWQTGIAHEVRFWGDLIKNQGGEWHEDFSARCSPNRPLQEHIISILNEFPQDEYDLLDVGAGPLTMLGKKWEGKNIRITATDPLAEQYEEILEKHGVTPVVRTVFGHAEKLSELFPENRFDLVHANNSIDHCCDPHQAIREMVKVVKKGRCVFLSHAVNEGENESYAGFHQWNFCSENGEFLIRNAESRTNITRELEPFCETHVEVHDGVWINVRIRKI